MSLKKRIKMLNTIESKAVVENRKNPNNTEIKIISFPLGWWIELKAECEQK